MEDEPTFAEPWQAQAFAIAVALHEQGTFGWDEWAATLSDALTREPDYWLAWLQALETMTARTGTDRAAIDARTEAWRAAADATPHGQPIVLPD